MSSASPEVEVRVNELCDMKTRPFREIVLKDIDGILDKCTRAALEHPTLSRRWLRAVEVEKGKTVQQLNTLRRDKTFKDRSALHRLDAYVHTLDAKHADVEWIDKKNRMERVRQQEETAAQRRREAAEKERRRQETLALRNTPPEGMREEHEALKKERKALKEERKALERIRMQLQSLTDRNMAAQDSGLAPKKDFKNEVLGELARRYPDEFVAILSAKLAEAGVDFSEADVRLALERITR